ncbi:MAG: hypothetical protein V4651_09635 [Bacteroidota bacterium]
MPDLIRESFLLKSDSVVSQDLMDTFIAAQQSGNYSNIAQYTQHHHTDQFSIYITHDIDWLNPLHPYSIVNYIRSVFSSHRWLHVQQFFQKDIFLRTIENILTIERGAGVNAIYHIGATNGKSFQRYGIRYNQSDKLYSALIYLLKSYNQHIGLHSSYDADEQHLIQVEKILLEKATTQTVNAHRSHFLHSHTQSLYPQLAQAGIRYEFGNGMAREIGLAGNIPGKYKPYDSISKKILDVTIVPLILMDNVFFVRPYHEVIRSFKETLHQVKEYNGSACILFHPENMILKPQLWNYFEEIIHICKQEGANINPSL